MLFSFRKRPTELEVSCYPNLFRKKTQFNRVQLPAKEELEESFRLNTLTKKSTVDYSPFQEVLREFNRVWLLHTANNFLCKGQLNKAKAPDLGRSANWQTYKIN